LAEPVWGYGYLRTCAQPWLSQVMSDAEGQVR